MAVANDLFCGPQLFGVERCHAAGARRYRVWAGGLLYWILSEDMSPLKASCLPCIAIMLTSSTFSVRPHLLTLVILVCWTHQLFAASRRLSAPHFGWLLLLVLWANLHAAFTMGFIIAFFAFLDFLERARLTRKDMLVKWLVFLALCPVVSLIHPYLWKAMLATFSVTGGNEAVPLINEWQPFNAQDVRGAGDWAAPARSSG